MSAPRPFALVEDNSSVPTTPNGTHIGGHDLDVVSFNSILSARAAQRLREMDLSNVADDEPPPKRPYVGPFTPTSSASDNSRHYHELRGFGEDTSAVQTQYDPYGRTPIGTPHDAMSEDYESDRGPLRASSHHSERYMMDAPPSSPFAPVPSSPSLPSSRGTRHASASPLNTMNSIVASAINIGYRSSSDDMSMNASGASTPSSSRGASSTPSRMITPRQAVPTAAAAAGAPNTTTTHSRPSSFLMPPPTNTVSLVGKRTGSAPRQSNVPYSPSSRGRGKSTGGRGGGGNGNGRGNSNHRSNRQNSMEIDEEMAAMELSVAVVEDYTPMLVGSVAEFDRRPWDDRSIISDVEAEGKQAFINQQHELWCNGYNPADERHQRYAIKELASVDKAVNAVMREAAEANGGSIVCDGIRLQPNLATADAVSSSDAAQRASMARLFDEEELNRLGVQQGPATVVESTFDVTPTNLMFTRFKLAKELTSARDSLLYNYLDAAEDREKVTVMVAAILLRMESAIDRVMSWLTLKNLDVDVLRVTSMEMAALQSEEILKKPRAALVLLLSIRMKASMLKRGQKKDELYQEAWHGGKRTHYWYPVVSMKKWVTNEVSLMFGPNQYARWLSTYFQGGGIDELVHRFMTTLDDNLLGVVDPDMDIHSFTNGLYDVERCQWMPYGSEPYKKKTSRAVFAYNFWPIAFRFGAAFKPDTGMFDSAAHGPAIHPETMLRDPSKPVSPLNWSKIHVECMGAFLDAQFFDYDTKLFIYFAEARTYRPKSRDRYQFDLFFIGVQGVGKSWALKQCGWVHPREYRRNIGTKIEETFGMQDFLNPDGTPAYRVAIAEEVGTEFKWASGELNVQVDGSECGVATKNGFFIRTAAGWEIPFICGGNKTFPYSRTEMPAVIRRWPHVFCMNRPVTESPTEEMLTRTMDAFLYVTSTARREFERGIKLKAFSSNPLIKKTAISNYIWDHAPPYFHGTKRRLLAMQPGIVKMVVDSMWLVHTDDPNHIVSISSLVNAAWLFNVLKSKSNTPGLRPSKDELLAALQISYERGVKIATFENPVVCELDGTELDNGEEYIAGFKFGENVEMRQAIITAAKQNGFNELMSRLSSIRSSIVFEHNDEDATRFSNSYEDRGGHAGSHADAGSSSSNVVDAAAPRPKRGRANTNGPRPPLVVGHEDQLPALNR